MKGNRLLCQGLVFDPAFVFAYAFVSDHGQ
jgi:hypothetical protein